MNQEKYTVAAVPYLNAIPLYVGLPELVPNLEINYCPPREAAKALKEGRADLGLVPVYALLDDDMKDMIALPDLGICCRGEVLSVYLGSQQPLSKVKEVYLDPESRSSIALTKVLAPKYLNKNTLFLPTKPGYESALFQKETRQAGLIIGDRALKAREHLPYRLDLGKAWHDYTGLPFVFALWAIRRECVSERLVESLRLACHLGIEKTEAIAENWAKVHNMNASIAERYLKEHIYYHVGPEEHEGLKRFIHMGIALGMIQPQKEVSYYDTAACYRQSTKRQEALGI